MFIYKKCPTSTNRDGAEAEGPEVAGLVLDAFQKYLGELTLRPMATPDDWDDFSQHVLDLTFDRYDSSCYNGKKICSTLSELKSVSTDASAGKADVILEIPAWKLLEIVTAITALAMALKQSPATSMMKTA